MIASDLVVLVRAKTDKLGGDLNKSKGMFDNFSKSMTKNLVAVAAPAAIGAAFFSLAGEMNQASDAADKFGISLEKYLAFDAIAKRSESSIESIGGAINKMKIAIASGKAGDILGLDNSSLRALSAEDAFMEAAKSIASITDPMKRAQVEMELFGRNGMELDSVITKLANDFGYWQDAVASAADAEDLAKLGEQIEDFQQRFKKGATQLGGVAADFIKAETDTFAAFGTGLATWTNPFVILRNMISDERLAKMRSSGAGAFDYQAEAINKATAEIWKMKYAYDAMIDPRGNAIRDFKDSLTGVNAQDVNRLTTIFAGWYDQIEGFKAAKDQTENWSKHIESVKQFGEELRKSTLTPLEEFQAKLEEIESWRREAQWRYDRTGEGMGNIDQIAARGIEQAKQRAIDAMKSMTPAGSPPSGDAVFNSREAANIMARAFNAEQKKGGNKDIEKVEKVAKEQLEVLKRIDKNTGKNVLAAANL